MLNITETVQQHTAQAFDMGSLDYSIPKGVHAIPLADLDLRPDSVIDEVILTPAPITTEKNFFFFWHTGYSTMHPYTKRNVRAYHRRFSKAGWTVHVISRDNLSQYLDTTSREIFPQASIDGSLTGKYAAQHTSDLVRWPLLLKYGGVYADVGMMQIGDLDALWESTIANDASPYELFSYNMGGVEGRGLSNYFMACRKNNPLFARSHKLLLALWAADGGKKTTEGMRNSPLIQGVPAILAGSAPVWSEGGRTYSSEESSAMLTDYIIQGQVLSLVMGLVDEEDGWNGPEYVAKHVFALDYMPGSQLINEYTSWNGPRAFELLSLLIAGPEQSETEDQKLAREIVEACLSRSFGFKLAHGLIIRMLGETLGSLWRANEGSDDVPGTYAHWLRYGMVYWAPDEKPVPLAFEVQKPFKTGPLLRAT